MTRIHLSPPEVGEEEREALVRALGSNWIAPKGPELDAFEQEMARVTERKHAVALTSGTAALHLVLLALNVGADADVLVPTLTFVATANAVRYVGARPVFVDSERRSWNVDPALLESELCRRASEGRLPAAVIAVDLYGQCADYTRVAQLCADHRVPLIEDAAEALGATCGSRPAGSFGTAAVLSFNGNKIVTTSSGGMLLTDDEVVARRTLHLATQAREPAAHYEHAELGFNYRMSNLLAAVGRAQLRSLPERQQRRGAVDDRYRAALGDVAGVEFLPRAPWGTSNHWLTCLTIDPGVAGAHRDDVIAALGDHDVEARPTWKPMHRQPLYRDAPAVLTGVADEIFDSGLCLPSGARLSEGDQGRIIDVVCATLAA